MTAGERWFAEPAEGDLPDGRIGGAFPRPPIFAPAASRLLIAAPSLAAVRSLLSDEVDGDRARQLAPAGIEERGARGLAEVGLVEEERGSVLLAALNAPGPVPAMPWPERENDGGDLPSSRRWLPSHRGVSLARRLREVLELPTERLLAHDGPLEWTRPLLPYQRVGIRELVQRDSLLLADDMGLGKTVQAIAALRVLIAQRRMESALVVAPVGLLGQWRRELRRWAPELRVSTVHGVPDDRTWQWRAPAHVVLTSYETLRADFTENPHAPVARTWDLVVLDEAQKIKNPGSDVSRVCKKLRRTRQWAMTGTPLENSPDDLVSILDFVDPASGEDLRHFVAWAGLRDALRRVQLRRRKADVLRDLPPKLVSGIVLPLTPRQRETYERAEREGIVELRAYGDRLQVQNVLDLIVRLRQICNVCPRTGESSKLSDLKERLAVLAEEGHKALVFTQFANAANGARAIAARLGPSALCYTGNQPRGEREETLDRFRTDPAARVLVLSLRAGGQGLNLQEASYVFHFDRWWNPAVESQAESRSHRLGQRHPVNVYTYTCENTIEERVDQTLRDKQLLFDALVDDVSLDVPESLTGEELFGLFGLPPPTARLTPATADAPGIDLATRVRRLLERLGWRIDGEPRGSVGQVDLTAVRTDDTGTEISLFARCAPRPSPVGVDAVRDLHAVLRRQVDARAVIVCPSGFTADAWALAADRGVALWDGPRLAALEAE